MEIYLHKHTQRNFQEIPPGGGRNKGNEELGDSDAGVWGGNTNCLILAVLSSCFRIVLTSHLLPQDIVNFCFLQLCCSCLDTQLLDAFSKSIFFFSLQNSGFAQNGNGFLFKYFSVLNNVIKTVLGTSYQKTPAR